MFRKSPFIQFKVEINMAYILWHSWLNIAPQYFGAV